MVSSITSCECRQLWFGSSRSVIGCEIRSASSTYNSTYNDNVRWSSACASVHFPAPTSDPLDRHVALQSWMDGMRSSNVSSIGSHKYRQLERAPFRSGVFVSTLHWCIGII